MAVSIALYDITLGGSWLVRYRTFLCSQSVAGVLAGPVLTADPTKEILLGSEVLGSEVLGCTTGCGQAFRKTFSGETGPYRGYVRVPFLGVRTSTL